MTTLERLKDLESKATPGPWFRPEGQLNTVYFDDAYVSLFTSNIGTDPTCKPADAALIVEMRNALPKLLAVVEAVQDTLCIETPKKVLDALAALDEQEIPKCEKCGHGSSWKDFHTVYRSGDPEPGYRCKKCGDIEWV